MNFERREKIKKKENKKASFGQERDFAKKSEKNFLVLSKDSP